MRWAFSFRCLSSAAAKHKWLPADLDVIVNTLLSDAGQYWTVTMHLGPFQTVISVRDGFHV